MLKLRTILLHNYPYIFLLILALTISFIRLNIPKNSHYLKDDKEFIGTIINYSINDSKATIILKGKEKLILNYYFKNQKEKAYFKENYFLNDTIKVSGDLKIPSKNTTFNLFNYKSYLKHKNIFYTVNVNEISKIKSNKNIYYYLKQKLIDRLNYNDYLYTFILGDKSYLSKDATLSYQENGLSHLFAISGMHISLLASLISKILKKLKISEKSIFFITASLLLIYLSITNISSSIIRGVLFYILFSINKIYYFYIKPTNLFIVAISITILINPNYLYDIAFYYSFSISLSLIIESNYLKSKNYIIGLLKVSFLSFIVSLPITLYTFHQINILSILLNLIYVPLVSIIIFPLSLLTVIVPYIIPIYNVLVKIMEISSIYLSKISIFKLIFPHLNICIYLLYYIFIIIFIKSKYKYYKLLILVLLIHYNYPILQNGIYINIIDVGQGDSILIHSKNEAVLIDTGGIPSYKNSWNGNKQSSSIIKNTTIPFLKTLGIRKINYLILTHGDSDHMGEAINLVKNFKVEKVVFNVGDYNYLEEDLIKVLNNKRIKYYKNIENLDIKNSKLYFLNTKIYNNENDNSNVIYLNYNNYKFLFMGDAGIEKEKDILEKYNLKDIDVLKVGHHGSKTSSSREFVDEVNPNYSIISVGKNNRYGHPNKKVLDNLKESKIYRTDQDGSIMFKINNKLKIETCSP